MINAVIYARYSSDNQREESIDGQIRECMAFAEKSGMTVLRTYIDRALSAKTDNRPEFQNMIKDSSKHLFDVVIVWKLDRFARNRYDSARYKAALKKNGVKVISATELISEGSEGIILESVLEGYAEYYSAELSEKVIRGMTDNALKCKFNGGSLPIGYIVNHEQLLEVDPLTAPVVLDVFNAYSEGKGMKQIADMLNERGIKTRRNTEIDVNIVHAMLKNRRYIGEYKYRDTVIPNGIPAIVSQDLFDRVGEKMAKNRKAPARHKAEDDYILTTKLFCGKCGGLMVGESGTGRKSIVHHYYKCVNVKNHKGCDKKTVKKDWIENLIVEYVMKAVMDDSIIEAVVDGVLRLQKQENRNLPVFEQQLAETKRAIENMLDAIQKGLLTSSTKNRLDQLEATKEDLEVKISLEKLQKPVLTKEYLTFWMHQFRKFDVTKLDQRKRLVDTFVNAIYLFDDKILFTLNYKDGSKTVSLADIGGSDLETSGAPAPILWVLFLRKTEEVDMWLQQLWDSKIGGLSKKQLFGKCLYVFVGNFIASVGCALFIDSQLGSDPVSVLLDGMSRTFGMPLGTASAIYTYTALFIAIFFAFKYLNIGSIISSIIWSTVLGWADTVIRGIVGDTLTLTTKLIMLGLGMLLMTLGIGIGVSARFGFGPMDSILFRICDRWPHAKYRYLKMCSDACFMFIGFLMGGIVGLGTICGFLLTGPGISFFIPLSNKYLLGIFDIRDQHNEKL